MHHHRCFDLTIASELALPELTPTAPAAADVLVRTGDAAPPADATALPHGLWHAGGATGLVVPGVGRYRVADGREIVVEAEPDAEPGHVRLFLLGTALGTLMLQRGHLVLHGNGVRVGGTAAVVLGHSGAGKSTLAAEFDRRGLALLSDDVVPVTGDGLALPGFPRIKLWADALDRLGARTDDLEPVVHRVEKFHVPLRTAAPDPLPLRHVFVLDRHDGPELELRRLQGVEAVRALREHTYRPELLCTAAIAGDHLQRCADLLGRARVVRVLRPAGTMSPEQTADAVLAHAGGSTTLQEIA